MSKRLRFIINSTLLSIGFVGIQFLEGFYRFPAIAGLVLLTPILFFWSLREGLGKNMSLISLILPTLFTLGVGIFWFLLPSNIFTKIPVVLFFAGGIYVLSLTMNIYTVSTIRTIALLRAAKGVGFVLTLVTSFLLFNAVLSLRQNLIFTLPLYFLASFLIFLQGFWSVELEKKMQKKVFTTTLVSSFVMAEIAAIIFFWPVTVVVGSLFLTSGVYLLLGLGQARLEERLFSATIREYLTVGIIVIIGMFFATHWG
jgi:hypothetical protein